VITQGIPEDSKGVDNSFTEQQSHAWFFNLGQTVAAASLQEPNDGNNLHVQQRMERWNGAIHKMEYYSATKRDGVAVRSDSRL
jgi:hypothetical protein